MKGLRPPELIASLGVTIATALPPALTGAMSAQILRDLGISHADLGIAIGACFLSNATLSPAAGLLVDRLGERNSVRLIGAVSSLSMIGMAAFGASFEYFICFLVVAGAAAAFAGPAGSVLLIGAFRPAGQSLLFGIRQAAVPAAGLVGGIAVPVFAAASLSWRLAFLVAGILVLAVVVPGRVGGRGKVILRLPAGGMVYRTSELWLLAIVFAIAGSTAISLNSFLVDYVVREGMSVEVGGTTLAVGSAVVVIIRIVAGYWVGRSRIGILELIAGMLLVGAAGFVGTLAGSGPVLLTASVFALAGAWGWSGLLLYAVTFGFAHRPGRANGILFAGGGAGGVLGPVITGWTVEHFSYATAWAVCAIFLIVSAILLIGLRVRKAGGGPDRARRT